MLERQLRVLDVLGLITAQPLLERHRFRNVADIGPRIELRHDDHLAQRRQLLGNLAYSFERIVPVAVIAIAIGAEEHLRLDLSEALEHAFDAEIRRAGRPDDALRERGERQHAGFGDIGNERCHPIARPQPERGERLRGARYIARQIGIADAPLKTGLVPEDEGVAAVAAPQKVLREIEPRLGEPVRAGHLVAVDEHRRALARSDHAAEIPRVGPELLGMVDRPAVELGKAVGVQLALANHLARKLSKLRVLDRALARLPKDLRTR